MQFAVAVAIDHRPDPIHVVGHLGIDAELIALGAAIAKRGDAKNGPRMIGFGGVATKQWPARVAGAGIDAATAMPSAEHVLQIIQVCKMKVFTIRSTHLRYGIIVVDTATVLHGYDGHVCLVQDAGADHVPVAPLAPADDRAVQVLGQRLVGARQARVANPAGGIDRLG